MKLALALFLAFGMINISLAQSIHNQRMKTIEVTGSSEREVTPDEIIFSISFEEYWEEFQGKKHEEYKTKVEIETIEDDLMSSLKEADIGMKDITLKNTGNYHRQRGKDFLISKTLEISLPSFERANELSNKLTTRGIRNMSVARLNHKNIANIKLEVQGEALKNARKKAEYLAAATGLSVKGVIAIVEVDKNAQIMPRPQSYARGASLMMAKGSSPGGAQYENFQKINVKAEVRVVWELE